MPNLTYSGWNKNGSVVGEATTSFERISGDEFDGTYRLELSVPQGANNNDDYFLQVYAYDNNDIYELYNSAITQNNQKLATASGENEYLQVVGGNSDFTGQEVSELTFTPQEINVESRAQTVVVEFRVQDPS